MAMTKKKRGDNDSPIASPSSVPSTTLFAIREAYKTVRANLLLNLDDKSCHVITLTSSLAGEGKSTSSINLAIAIAQFNKRVLMIDGDLRKRRASRYLKLHSTVGLTDVLRGDVSLDGALSMTKYPNFDFISAGSPVSTPAEMLASNAMMNLVERLRSSYDFILIDTPPVNVVSDALPLIKKSEGVIVVAREQMITTVDFGKLLENLNMIGANIIGMIYIGSDSTQPYYHGKYYGRTYKNYGGYEKLD